MFYELRADDRLATVAPHTALKSLLMNSRFFHAATSAFGAETFRRSLISAVLREGVIV